MKTLLIGMDGAQESTFRRGWTPYIESLIDNGTSLTLWENLVSRGWAEIITGQHGVDTGALYDRPDLGGSHAWSQRFKLEDIPGYGQSVKPLWQKLNEAGFRVGIMNVPTAFPAPDVEGFFVSGGGGGGPVLQDPLPNLCYPEAIHKTLLEMGYIVDERLGSLLAKKKLYDPDAFFGRLVEKNERRTDAFVRLALQYDVDFGFVVYKSSSNIAEFLLLPELDRLKLAGQKESSPLVKSIGSYYRHFDIQLQRLMKSFPDSQVLLVSDHGMSARRFLVNPNSFLVEMGFQAPSHVNRGVYDFINRFKKLIPFSIRTAIRKQAKMARFYESLVSFDIENTLAFCLTIGDWSHGIHINDKERFGGPVSSRDRKSLALEISDAFNQHPASIKHGLSASLCPDSNSPAKDYYPDIELKMPNGYMTTNEEKQFIMSFELPRQALDIDSVTKGRLLCGKAHNPLAVISNGTWQVSPSEEKNDLRLIYDQVLASFNID